LLEENVAYQTTYTSARARLAELWDKAVNDREVIVVERKGHEEIAIIALAELRSLMETVYLLRSPKNAERLRSAFDRALKNGGKPIDLDELADTLLNG
jgi:antitoxin YefM